MGNECKLPRTATRRGAICFMKLLERVDPDASDGFGFHGRLFRPGQMVQVEELGERPILLEGTDGGRDRAERCRIRYTKLYILWRREAGSWIEIARTEAEASEWAYTLREPARIALGKVSWATAPRVSEVVGRIRKYLDGELGMLEQSQRRQVLAELHDQFSMQQVQAMSA